MKTEEKLQRMLKTLIADHKGRQRITINPEAKPVRWKSIEITKRRVKGNTLTLTTEAGSIRITYEVI